MQYAICYMLYVCYMLCYVMLCYVMLCYVMLCYVMLCYIIVRSCFHNTVCAVSSNSITVTI